ncbi:hypothetical protein HMPREF9695_00549 [Afipia broomeae ATCC 49717]|uniref:DUF4935 domain-containing protein n=2 Tax=Afipia broomeae TaxID=56946 RepID=K8PFP4_9BRAD|nr:hypothetical protein HMPREF9695_00549 [Afipia broomeae ATCC 49717]
MKYGAITFDTQTVEHNAFHFDGGLLSQLKQFKDGPVRIVLSEIVLREIFKHLLEKTKSARDAAVAAHKKALDHGLADADKPFVSLDVDYKAVARARLDRFVREIGAEIVRVDNVSMKTLMSSYFQPAAPFSSAGKNKAEFPDAIALLSLQKWAEDNKIQLLGVSGDKGWNAFAASSNRIDLVNDLSEALSLVQKHNEEMSAIVQTLIESIDTATDEDLKDEFVSKLSNEVSGYSVYAEADSFYDIEAEQVDIELSDSQFVGDASGYDFSVVQASRNLIVAKITLEASIKAEAIFHMSVYDSIDKDSMGIGSTEASTEQDVTFAVLVTFEREDAAASFGITSVEIVDGPKSLNFGYIEPDYEPDYDEDYEIPLPPSKDQSDDEVPI